mmetsp:Transcript_39295/g.57811  ORF Transcript_39295/g.57811 Transcript_39295/m.57811 type:complete len:216 (-) Transcript_39295:1232-1879(-)
MAPIRVASASAMMEISAARAFASTFIAAPSPSARIFSDFTAVCARCVSTSRSILAISNSVAFTAACASACDSSLFTILMSSILMSITLTPHSSIISLENFDMKASWIIPLKLSLCSATSSSVASADVDKKVSVKGLLPMMMLSASRARSRMLFWNTEAENSVADFVLVSATSDKSRPSIVTAFRASMTWTLSAAENCNPTLSLDRFVIWAMGMVS